MSPREDQKVRGVILAGDHPWNETSLDSVLPRALAPVAYSPLICYPLRWLETGGIIGTTICANSESRHVRKCLGDGSGMGVSLDYYEDWTPRGPAGCVRDAALQSDADIFVVIEGTVIPRLDLAELLRVHRGAEAGVTVVVSSDRRAAEGHRDHLTPTGIYVFQREILEHVSETGYQDIKEVLIPQLYVADGRVVTFLAEHECPRVSDAASYLSVNGWMLTRIMSDPDSLPGYRKIGDSRVHHSARLAGTAKLVGPVLIGPYTDIAGGATIVGPTIIGTGCNVEKRAVICRSVVLDRCLVGKGSIVDQCAIMHKAAVEPGKKLCHVIHNNGHVSARKQAGSLLQRLLPKRKEVDGRRSAGKTMDMGLVTRRDHITPNRTDREMATEPHPL